MTCLSALTYLSVVAYFSIMPGLTGHLVAIGLPLTIGLSLLIGLVAIGPSFSIGHLAIGLGGHLAIGHLFPQRGFLHELPSIGLPLKDKGL